VIKKNKIKIKKPVDMQAFPSRRKREVQSLSSMIALRCHQVRWSGPGTEELEQA
jgi:hypothetical protein